MRILHVITSLHVGGAERLMTLLLPKLRNLGNEVELLVFDGTKTAFWENLENEGIKIHTLETRRVYDPRNIIRLRKFIHRYDIIHTHNTACQLFVPLAKVLSFNKNTKLYTTEHSTSNRRRNKWWLKPLDKWMYGKYFRVICIAESTEANLISHVGKRAKTTVIHNGIRIPDLKNDIKELGGDIIISMVAAFRVGKDQETVVKALKLLPDRFKLRLIGDGERRKEIEQLAKSLDVSERVEFLGNRRDVNELLQQSHINVLSSHWEGFGLSAVEGMALGLPTIVSNVEGLGNIVNGFGLLFPDGDHESLAKEVKRLCDNPDLYFSVARKCINRAHTFDINKTCKNYDKIYHSINK